MQNLVILRYNFLRGLTVDKILVEMSPILGDYCTSRVTAVRWYKEFQCGNFDLHGEKFIAIFTTLSMVICFSMGTLGISVTLVNVLSMRVVLYDILSMAIIPILATSILFCNLCYILL